MTTHTEKEILSQPEVWQQTIDDVDPMSVLVCRFGGGRHRHPRHRLWVHALPGDVSSCTPSRCRTTCLGPSGLGADSRRRSRSWLNPGGTLLLAISRSGTTTETVWLSSTSAAAVGTRSPSSPATPTPLSRTQADVVWAAPAAAEKSVAQTRSFSSMQVIVSAHRWCAAWAPISQRFTRCHPQPRTILDQVATVMRRWPRDRRQRVVLLSGVGCAVRHRLRGNAEAEGDVAHRV